MPLLADPPHAPGPPSRLVLLGHPVAHSLSPRFQHAALAAAGLAVHYDAVDVAPGALDDALDELRRASAAGNVTVPYKTEVAARCAVLRPLAARVGAVNTFWFDAGGRLVGDNTDVGGFDAAVEVLVDRAAPQRVALVGAGGSAAAVVAAVAGWSEAQLRVWSRRPEPAYALAARAPGVASVAPTFAAALDGATLVVNATPLGLYDGDPLPVAVDQLPRGAAVFDLAYAPARTAWVRAARHAGHPAEDGLGMLVEQGALSFARWFAREPDRAAMWRALASVTAARAER